MTRRILLLALAALASLSSASATPPSLARDGSGLTPSEKATLLDNLGLGASSTVQHGTVRAGTFGQDGVTANLDGTLIADGATSNSIIKGAGVYGHGIWDNTGNSFLIYNSAPGELTVSASATWVWLGSSKAAFLNALGLGSINGIVKFNGSGVPSQAVAGTDYAPATIGTTILKGNGSGGTQAATLGVDYAPATSGTSLLKGNGSGGTTAAGASDMPSGIDATKLGAGTVDNTELGYLDGVTSGVQGQIDLREGRDYVYSDGATSNRAAIWQMGAVGNLAGAASATWRGTVTWPTSFSAGGSICSLYSSATTTSDAAHMFRVVIYSANGGTLEITQFGATATDARSFVKTGMVAAYGGQTGTLEIALTQGTANPVVRWNDVDISAGFTASTGGTPPTWLDSGMICTYATAGLNWPAGRSPLGCWINGTLTAADRTFWRLHGRPPAWVQFGGSMVEATTNSDTRTFTSSAGQWNGGVTASGGVGVFSGAVQYWLLNQTLVGGGYPARVQVDFDLVDNPTGLSVSVGNGLSGGSVDVGAALGHKTAVINLAQASSAIYLNLAGLSTSAFSIDNFSVHMVGALSLPVVQPIQALDDATGNGQCARLSSGMTPVTTRKDWRIVARTSTNGNEQLLGGGCLPADYTNLLITSWCVRNNGSSSRTINLGSISTGSDYVSGGTAAVGSNLLLSTPHLGDSSALYCNSNGTDELVHTITGIRLGK